MAQWLNHQLHCQDPIVEQLFKSWKFSCNLATLLVKTTWSGPSGLDLCHSLGRPGCIQTPGLCRMDIWEWTSRCELHFSFPVSSCVSFCLSNKVNREQYRERSSTCWFYSLSAHYRLGWASLQPGDGTTVLSPSEWPGSRYMTHNAVSLRHVIRKVDSKNPEFTPCAPGWNIPCGDVRGCKTCLPLLTHLSGFSPTFFLWVIHTQ